VVVDIVLASLCGESILQSEFETSDIEKEKLPLKGFSKQLTARV
jgi:hypothetical protein